MFLYESRFATVEGALRTGIKLELTANTPLTDCVPRNLRPLAARLAPEHISVANCVVPCASLEETVAEKIIAYLRRTAQEHAQQYRGSLDPYIIRHLYDVTRILAAAPDTLAKTQDIFWAIVERDRIQFGRQFPAFGENPAIVLQESLAVMRQNGAVDGMLERNYKERVVPLVWNTCPPFTEILAGFAQAAEHCLAL
ncbi:MAG: nucleotidyl transferase AbiEii/AbiGii toxin family protein [Acidiferrobacter sp.]